MRLRHVAVLALVGWYLMVPPWNRLVPSDPDPQAPLNEWTDVASFDTVAECNGAIAEHDKKALAALGPIGSNRHTTPWDFAKCIATDDPRLKKK